LSTPRHQWQPYPPAYAQQPASRRGRRVGWLIAAVVAVAGAGLGTFLLIDDSGDDEDAAVTALAYGVAVREHEIDAIRGLLCAQQLATFDKDIAKSGGGEPADFYSGEVGTFPIYATNPDTTFNVGEVSGTANAKVVPLEVTIFTGDLKDQETKIYRLRVVREGGKFKICGEVAAE